MITNLSRKVPIISARMERPSAMVTVSILKLREKQISRELIFTLMERPKEKLSIFRS